MLTGVDTRLTFLHTSDIHSRLFPFEQFEFEDPQTVSDPNLRLTNPHRFRGVAEVDQSEDVLLPVGSELFEFNTPDLVSSKGRQPKSYGPRFPT